MRCSVNSGLAMKSAMNFSLAISFRSFSTAIYSLSVVADAPLTRMQSISFTVYVKSIISIAVQSLTRICHNLHTLMNLIVFCEYSCLNSDYRMKELILHKVLPIIMNNPAPRYPHNPIEWHLWIEEKLNISKTQGIELFNRSSFPTNRLKECWNQEFTAENGYSPDFIPALLSHVNGLLNWIYSNGQEPNWRSADDLP